MLRSGQRLPSPTAHYVINAQIGEGGFGVTFKGTREHDGAEVVLKVLKFEKMAQWKSLELFHREAETLRALNHPRVPRYEEFFASNGEDSVDLSHGDIKQLNGFELVLVQAFVEGENLQEYLEDGHRITPENVMSICESVLQILDYLHTLSPPVIHRDVNPKNIILAPNGEAHLVDFGAIQQTIRSETLAGSTNIGTYGYSPMEQMMGKARPESDLYGLGATLLYLLSGIEPVHWPMDDATSKVNLSELGLVTNDGHGVRDRLCRLISRLVEPIASMRPASAEETMGWLSRGAPPKATPVVVAVNEKPKRSFLKALFLLALGGSIGGAGIIYPLNFSEFSETRMIEMAPFWVLPAAFGGVGFMALNTKRPLRNAIIGSILAAGALAFFFQAIFPAL